MAQNKKSVLLYCDVIHTVEKMDDKTAGEFFKHYLRYINDKNPETDNLLVEIAFESIKQNLKRDLQKWENKKEVKSVSGSEGNLKRWHPDIYKRYKAGEISLNESLEIAKHRNPIKPIAKVAVNANVTVTDNVTVTVTDKDIIKKSNTIERRKLKFADTLKPFFDVYGKTILNDFYLYWTEPNKSNTKFRQELQKTWSLERRLSNWVKNDKNFNTSKNGNQQLTATERNRKDSEATRLRIAEKIQSQLDDSQQN